MKHIALFTIYICNYGAVLQTYALKTFIENSFKDFKVTVIDFYSHEHYRIFTTATKNILKKIVKYGIILLHYNSLLKRNNREKRFISKEFNLSDRYLDIEALLHNMPKFDYYLTGSDQVFNENSKYLELFFQQFECNSGIKVAYAPSFGKSNFSEEERLRLKSLTKDFDYLSCRESDGADMLSQVHGKDIPCVMDPTLLLTADEWGKMMILPKSDKPYLLVYDLNGGERMLNIAKRIANDYNLKVYCITRHAEVCYIYKNIDKVIYNAGPREFVGYFANASYVVTDSFHGTAFSIIFRKSFNTYIAVEKASQRIKSLLNTCGLNSRMIDNPEVFDASKNCYCLFNEDNYLQYRQLSINYLSSIFSTK